jgi:hypothetical protein
MAQGCEGKPGSPGTSRRKLTRSLDSSSRSLHPLRMLPGKSCQAAGWFTGGELVSQGVMKRR